MTLRFGLGFLVLTWMATVSLGCNDSAQAPANVPAQDGGTAAVAPVAPPTVPEFILPKDWDAIQMVANFARTNVDSAAHFITTRNACGHDAVGSLDITTWNIIAKDVNAALAMEPLTEQNLFCVPYPDNFKMDGTVDIVLNNGKKRELYTNRGGEVCSTIRDAGISSELLDAMNKVVIVADHEECPNGFNGGH